jgi:dinuclear metal center YbgI/SA1388 family protein
MQVHDIVSLFDDFAPVVYQESYDNSGLQLGSPQMEVTGILLTIDVTEDVIDEAVSTGCNLIVSHHPLLFSGIRRITDAGYTERAVMKAIRNDIAVISSHTSLDASFNGVNEIICRKLGLSNLQILSPAQGKLRKLVTFVPNDHAQKVREALFLSGAGKIGNYDSCSFNSDGVGSFRGDENTSPFTGERGKLHLEAETRIETIFPMHLQNIVIKALKEAHPYEEVAFDIYTLENEYSRTGMGMIGEVDKPSSEAAFIQMLKNVFGSGIIRHTEFLNRPVKKIAVCGGSGAFLINKAIKSGAQFIVTGDIKYHQFFDAQKQIVIADVGHFESEQFTTEIFYNLIIKKFPKFAVRFSEINTNPIKYF